MAKVLIIYYSRTGNTKKMAELIADGIKAKGADVTLKKAEDATPDDMKAADGIIIGSPTYYGTMAAEIKKLFDDSVKFHGRLDGRLGAAFSTSANIAGGNETTIVDILNAMLIHGFIIQGDPQGSHYGPVSIGSPDARAKKECQRLAERFVDLLNRVKLGKG
jgi:NAD(P)H dehydrogenase (quinone)